MPELGIEGIVSSAHIDIVVILIFDCIRRYSGLAFTTLPYHMVRFILN